MVSLSIGAGEGPYPLCLGPLRVPHSSPFLSHSFVPCSEKIHLAVTEMASLFPKVLAQRGEEWENLGGGADVGNPTTAWVETSAHQPQSGAGLKSKAHLPLLLPPEASPGACAQLTEAAQCQRLQTAE